MATWRCPHCRTVQVDGPRCFVCDRSATSCGTCVRFRRSFVGGIGYCALDRRREPLTGAEQRPCWTAAVEAAPDGLLFSSQPTARSAQRPDRLVETFRPPVSGR